MVCHACPANPCKNSTGGASRSPQSRKWKRSAPSSTNSDSGSSTTGSRLHPGAFLGERLLPEHHGVGIELDDPHVDRLVAGAERGVHDLGDAIEQRALLLGGAPRAHRDLDE